jgi:hypothetical protein
MKGYPSLPAFMAAVMLVTLLSGIVRPTATPAQVRPIIETTIEPEKLFDPIRSRAQDDQGNPAEYRYISAIGVTTFVAEMKKLGEQGYRLESVAVAAQTAEVILAPPPERFKKLALAAVFRLDNPNTYEYDWFEADIPGEIVTRINKRASNGFYYRDGVFATDDTRCRDDDFSTDDSSVGTSLRVIESFHCWSQGGVYFMERKNGVIAKREYRVHTGNYGWGKKPTGELEDALGNTGPLGFRPVALGRMKVGVRHAFYALVERDKGAEGEPVKTQYKFLKSRFRFSKKVNAIGREGYRIRFTGMMGVLENALLETEEGASPVSYRWVDASGKSHEQELANVLSAGARFVMISRETEDLIFEERPGEKYEYRILKMDVDIVKPTRENPNPQPAKTQEQIFREFDAALAEGYVIRDVFYSAGTKVLFERRK